MPKGSKKKYTAKQIRQADHIQEGYLHQEASKKKAAEIAWRTVNKETGGAKKERAKQKK